VRQAICFEEAANGSGKQGNIPGTGAATTWPGVGVRLMDRLAGETQGKAAADLMHIKSHQQQQKLF
jgi:hypothetical protein